MNKRESKDIFIRQNEKYPQSCIRTWQYVYRSAKNWVVALFACLVVLPIVVNIVLNFITNEIAIGVLFVVSFVLLIVGQIIRHIFKQKKFLAAGIQQRFDVHVFDLDNTCRKYLVQKLPSSSLVIAATKKYENKKVKNLENWYSDYSKLPYEQAVFYCQKENINWTVKLKKAYIIFLAVSLSVLVVGVVINSIVNRDSVFHLLLTLSTLLPLISYFTGGFQKLFNDIKRQREILEKMEQTEKDLNKLSTKQLNDIVEEIQVEIYIYRQKAYMVPEWFYWATRKRFQGVEDETARTASENYKPKDRRKRR